MSASISSLVDNLFEINKKESVNELIEKFSNRYWFCNGDLNKFSLLLKKGVHPYEYMNSWEKFNEVSLPDKKYFYSKLNKDEDYWWRLCTRSKSMGSIWNKKSWWISWFIYVQGDTLLLADVFENFRDICTDTYELNPAYFLSASGLALASLFKKDWSKIRVINW